MADYLGGQYGTGYPVPNSSIGFDWLKQMLGINADAPAATPAAPAPVQLAQPAADPLDGLLSSFPARPDYVGTNVMPGVSMSQFAARPDFVSNNTAPAPVTTDAFPERPKMVGTNTAPTPVPAAPTMDAPAAAATPAAANLMNNGLFGTGQMVDPTAIDPATGLTNAQALQMKYNMLGSVGSRLLAAGQLLMPKDRAAILAGMGDAAGEQMNMMTQMQQRLLQNNKLARENALKANLVNVMKTPDFQKQFDNMPPQMAAVAKAAAAAGDLETVSGLIEKTQPKVGADGTIYDPQTGVVRNIYTGQTYVTRPGAGSPLADSDIPTGQDGLPLSGEAYLQTIKDPVLRAQIKQVAEGNAPLPTGRQASSGPGLALIRGVAQYDPNGYSNIVNGARVALSKSFTSGEESNQIKAINTLTNHLVGLQKSAAALNNSDFDTYNNVANWIKSKSGSPEVNTFNINKQAVVEELGRVLKGTVTEGEVNRWNALMNDAQSPSQLQDAINKALELMQGRLSEIGNKWEQGFNKPGAKDNGRAFLSKQARENLEYIEKNPLAGSRPAATAAQPSAMPKAGDVVKGWKFKGGNPADKNNWEKAE